MQECMMTSQYIEEEEHVTLYILPTMKVERSSKFTLFEMVTNHQ